MGRVQVEQGRGEPVTGACTQQTGFLQEVVWFQGGRVVCPCFQAG